MVCVTARSLGDSYCSLAWGSKLAELAGSGVATEVLRGDEAEELPARERALKRWAEQVVRDPKQATATQIDDLTTAGLSDLEIFEATVCIAFRLAFPTINDALDARPDHQLVAATPPEVKAAVTYGREPA